MIERIAAAAARLVMENGLTGATTDRIAAEAGVARATFFRYFESKEYAVAEGFTAMWIAAITDALRRQPPELSATDALAAAFRELAAGFEAISGQIADIERHTRESLSCGPGPCCPISASRPPSPRRSPRACLTSPWTTRGRV